LPAAQIRAVTAPFDACLTGRSHKKQCGIPQTFRPRTAMPKRQSRDET
jgi:hypothetical protein